MAATKQQKQDLQSSTIDLIVYHDNCGDGIASMMIAKRAFPRAKIVAVNYGSTLDELAPRSNMLFVDMTPPRDRVADFVNAGAWVVDHHAKAKDIVDRFGLRGIFGDEKTEPGVSGAWLIADALSLTDLEPIKIFARTVGVYDTWQTQAFEFEAARVVQEVLRHFPDARWEFRIAHANGREFEILTEAELEFGRELVATKNAAVQKAVDNCVLFEVGYMPKPEDGSSVWLAMFNDGNAAISMAAEALREGAKRTGAPAGLSEDDGADPKLFMVRADVACGFFYTQRANLPRMTFSLRSNGKIDVGAFCRSMGGGGHSRAAGFTVDGGPEPFSFLVGELRKWVDAERQLDLGLKG